MSDSFDHDIVIIGSGPAGCAAGIMMQSKGYETAIIDKRRMQHFTVGETLQPDIKHVLALLGIQDSLLTAHHQPAYEKISLWDSITPIFNDSLFNPNGNGWHLDKGKFNESLIDTAKATGVQLINCNRLIIENLWPSGWKVTYMSSEGEKVSTCSYLFDCSGRNRLLLKKFGLPVVKFDSLISMNILLSLQGKDFSSAAIIESVQNGWWYSSPLNENRRLISFFTDAKSLPFKQAINYQHFLQSLATTKLLYPYTKFAEQIEEVMPCIRYANSEISTEFYGKDWICVGDSAAAFDPLSSQGIGTALKMGVEASFAVDDYLKSRTKAKLEQFSQHYRNTFQQYLTHRKKFYASVKKWPYSSFWLNNSN